MKNLQLTDFAVHVFLIDGSHETACQNVSAKQAADTFWHLTNTVSAKTGIAKRVILTDGLDCTILEWQFGRGYTFDGEEYMDRPVLRQL